MITYRQAAAVRQGLRSLGIVCFRIFASIGNSPGLDSWKYDEDDPIHMDVNQKALGFAPDEMRAYSIEVERGRENDGPGASLDAVEAFKHFTRRGDGLADYQWAAACPGVKFQFGTNATDNLLNLPMVREGWEAQMEKARQLMGV